MVKSKPWLLRCLWLLPVLLLFMAVWWAQPAPSIRLMRAIDADNPEAIRKAFKKGADLNRVFGEREPHNITLLDRNTPLEDEYTTPLTYAIQQQQWEAMRELLRLGAKPNVRDKAGQYPIMLLARMNPNLSDMRLMLNNGADVNVGRGEAVFIIAESCSTPLLKLILEHGANVRQRDPKGFGPMAYVDSSWPGAHNVRKLLREHGAKVEQRPKFIPPPRRPGSPETEAPESTPNVPSPPELAFSQPNNVPLP